ncbi:hypothetical protein E1B28_009737 [Marasmius oreades]|uniref:Uncharacterized protein n=1 Tax=Marasmius oreades TaxID=181124 RepID=A0A9P7UR17_9AGAR|nr:uncharacterized protein E1B28_009737 [Marasmius oreades]KAG7090635.1 hypothetical protein E1B28_009737 [Marasmius oreades]
MSAAAKAEARRKAILSRGTDRLAKLTTSARGEDAPYMRHESPPAGSHSSNVRNFVGEESNMPTPPARASPGPTTSPSSQRKPSTNQPEPDVSAWSEEQQQQFLQAIMGGFGARGGPDSPGQPALGGTPGAPQIPPSLADNPLAAMLFGAAGAQGGNGSIPPFPPPGIGLGKSPAMDGGIGTQVKTKKQSKFQKLMPLVHLVAIWTLLAYFVLVREPEAHITLRGEVASDWKGVWRRWAELAYRSPYAVVDSTAGQGWTVAVLPFFWAFMALQIALHSTRIFNGFDAAQPPALLAMVLPHLPPPFPSLIVNGLKYIHMGSTLLDDLAILAVGTGFVIWIAGLLSSK